MQLRWMKLLKPHIDWDMANYRPPHRHQQRSKYKYIELQYNCYSIAGASFCNLDLVLQLGFGLPCFSAGGVEFLFDIVLLGVTCFFFGFLYL